MKINLKRFKISANSSVCRGAYSAVLSGHSWYCAQVSSWFRAQGPTLTVLRGTICRVQNRHSHCSMPGPLPAALFLQPHILTLLFHHAISHKCPNKTLHILNIEICDFLQRNQGYVMITQDSCVLTKIVGMCFRIQKTH